jgi:hypothetical protein
VKFRAEKSGKLSQMLGVSSRITKAEAYAADNGRLEVALRFDGKTVAGIGFELLQNTPNPVLGYTNIAFFLPEATEATLTLTNAEGRVLKVVKNNYEQGWQTLTFRRSDLEAGILFYQLETSKFRATKKMVVVD